MASIEDIFDTLRSLTDRDDALELCRSVVAMKQAEDLTTVEKAFRIGVNTLVSIADESNCRLIHRESNKAFDSVRERRIQEHGGI